MGLEPIRLTATGFEPVSSAIPTFEHKQGLEKSNATKSSDKQSARLFSLYGQATT